jgi:hypothetical protein
MASRVPASPCDRQSNSLLRSPPDCPAFCKTPPLGLVMVAGGAPICSGCRDEVFSNWQPRQCRRYLRPPRSPHIWPPSWSRRRRVSTTSPERAPPIEAADGPPCLEVSFLNNVLSVMEGSEHPVTEQVELAAEGGRRGRERPRDFRQPRPRRGRFRPPATSPKTD